MNSMLSWSSWSDNVLQIKGNTVGSVIKIKRFNTTRETGAAHSTCLVKSAA
jgi:DNA-directed RNA polymerase subunit H (RpoH/RPB5)